MKHRILFVICCFLMATGIVADAFGAGFIHPGISHNSSELEFIKAKLKAQAQPWQQAWDQLRDSSYAELSWKPRPVAHVERGATTGLISAAHSSCVMVWRSIRMR